MKILISAAEASSDMHGAQLLHALKEELKGQGQKISLEVFGVGGPLLQAQGLKPVIDARSLLSMGIVEVLSRLPQVIRALNRVTQAAREEKPDLALVIDYPEFHFRLAKRLNRLNIPVFYYIPPKVWVWRKKRLQFIRQYFKKVFLILPFEQEIYEKEGVPALYVGNPLLDELPLHLTRQEARMRLGIELNETLLVLMPGSRPSELKYHLDVMLDSALQVSKKLSPKVLRVLMPLPHTADLTEVNDRVELWKQKQGVSSGQTLPFVQVSQGNAHECLVAADAGIIKSGTSTLEAGLLRCPHTIIYNASRITGWIFKNIVRYQGPVGLVNLIHGVDPGQPYLIRELLGEQISVEELTRETLSLLTDQERRKKLNQGFERLLQKTKSGSVGQSQVGPSQRVAQEILREFVKGRISE